MNAPHPIIFVVIEPKTSSDQDKITQGLRQLPSESATLRIDSDVRTGQTIIGGMGESQLELVIDRLRRDFNVQATFTTPRIAYRATFTKQAEGEGRYVRQVEGHGHYAHVKIRLLPAEAGTGYVFESQVGDDVIPREFVRSIDAGIRERLTRGVFRRISNRRCPS